MSPLQHLLHSPITSNFASLSGQWFQSLFQANIRPNMPESIWAKQSSLGLMWLKNLLPIFKLLFMLYSKVLYCSLVSFVLSFSMETDFHVPRLKHLTICASVLDCKWCIICGIILGWRLLHLWLELLCLPLIFLITVTTVFQLIFSWSLNQIFKIPSGGSSHEEPWCRHGDRQRICPRVDLYMSTHHHFSIFFLTFVSAIARIVTFVALHFSFAGSTFSRVLLQCMLLIVWINFFELFVSVLQLD